MARPSLISNVFGFDARKFGTHEQWRQWMAENWKIGYYAALVYIVALHIGIRFMKNRAPIRLSPQAKLLWNSFFSTLSAFGFLRTFSDLILTSSTEKNGLENSMCRLEPPRSTTSAWGLVFCFLKIFEFGDTVIRVLRKKRVPCFHWFHRVIVCIYCWSSYGSDPTARWFYVTNYYVNFLIYGYYAMKSPNSRWDSTFYICVRTFQLLQVIIGLSINIFTLGLEIQQVRCHRLVSNVFLGLFVHSWDFVLLFQHIILTCFPKPSASQKAKSD